MDKRAVDQDSNMAGNKGRNGKDSGGKAADHDVCSLYTHTFSPHFAAMELGIPMLMPPN